MRLTMSSARTTFLALTMVAALVAGCGKKAAEQTTETTPPPAAVTPLRVVNLELGTAVGATKEVTAPTTTFKPSDTIYLSVATEGAAPSANLGAKWTYGADNQLVNEMNEPIGPTGPAHTEFHISKPDGMPAGKYKVEVTLDGAPVGTKEFEVH